MKLKALIFSEYIPELDNEVMMTMLLTFLGTEFAYLAVKGDNYAPSKGKVT